MAKLDRERDQPEDSATPANAPEKIITVKERRRADPVTEDKPAESSKDNAPAAEVIDAEWVEARDGKTAPTPPASRAGVDAARIHIASEKPSDFSFLSYVLLFFGAALLSALVMLAVMEQV